MNANGALCVSAHTQFLWKAEGSEKNFAWPKRGQWQMNIYYVKMQLHAQSCLLLLLTSPHFVQRLNLNWDGKLCFCDDGTRTRVLVRLAMVAQMLCIFVSYQDRRHRIDALKTVQIYLTSFVCGTCSGTKSGNLQKYTRRHKHNCFKREKLNYSTVYVHSTNTNECSAINYLSYFDGLAIFFPHFERFH